jgi:hypothetical protein
LDEEGDVIGGCIHALERFVEKAGKKASAVRNNGERALVVEGFTLGLTLGEVFVT